VIARMSSHDREQNPAKVRLGPAGASRGRIKWRLKAVWSHTKEHKPGEITFWFVGHGLIVELDRGY